MILVTGATGKVGQEVVRQLAAAGVPARALVRDPAGRLAHPHPGHRDRGGGPVEARDPRRRVRGHRPRSSCSRPPRPTRSSSRPTRSRPALRAGVQRIVKVSVAGGPDAGTQIGRWHWATEKQIEASGIDFTFLRPTIYMQQMYAYAPSIAGPGHVLGPDGHGRDRARGRPGRRRGRRLRAHGGRARPPHLRPHGAGGALLRRRRRRDLAGDREEGDLRPRPAGVREEADARRRRAALARGRHDHPDCVRSARATAPG